MRKTCLLFLVASMAAFAAAAQAAEYDRYGRPVAAPPPRGEYVPPPRHAMHGQPYMNIQLGLFDPNTASDGLDGYDSGYNFDVAFGSRVSPIFAFEGTVGGYGADRGNNEVRVVPLTIGARLIIPHPFFEPYFTGGFGFYFAHLKEDPVPPVFSGIDDSDATFGGYLGAGFDAWLNNRMALNFEGKYQMANPTFSTNAGNNIDVDVSGWTVSLGLRIAFGGPY